jgi:2-oxo-hept-3-ene-1,7-dioate hydratase
LSVGCRSASSAVRRTHEAERTGKPVRALSFEQPEMTIEDAYAIQRRWMELKIAEGVVRNGIFFNI